MKKTMMAVVTAAVVGACSSEPKYLSYEGLSMGLPAKVFADSLLKRGMVVDTLNEETDRVVMLMPGETKKVTVIMNGEAIASVQESYEATYNDSTRQLFKKYYDRLVEEINPYPEMPKNAEDHKEARFQADEGMVTLILENTYTPSFGIVYENKQSEE
ncbi:MAG: hypothetical protein SPI57_00365 [Prevotella sp.]|nr:hypothetical protein [Prevotella sp.]MCI5854652.1 hypothetical protein [Prevotella sp.]MDD6737067.1 hypothetical protein [Prevotella sp.]MDY6091634.1 hypothetical protein [Prevotella sp.]